MTCDAKTACMHALKEHTWVIMQGRGGPGLVASADGSSLYVVGGFAGYELNDVHRFDLGTRTWDCPACCSGEGAPDRSLLPARSVFGVSAHSCAACDHGGHLVSLPLSTR